MLNGYFKNHFKIREMLKTMAREDTLKSLENYFNDFIKTVDSKGVQE